MTNSINAGIDAWVIEDGNYSDFEVGQEIQFALAFYPLSLKPSDSSSRSVAHMGGNRYKICAQVVFKRENLWVIDMGFLAYTGSHQFASIKEHDWIEGDGYIGVDEFDYREARHKDPSIPDITYSFKIEQIFLDTTPWVARRDQSGRTVMCRSEQQQSFREVAETDAWNDDDGNASYVLKCVYTETRT